MAKITITTNAGIVADSIENIGLGGDLAAYDISKRLAQQIILEQIIEAVTWAVREEQKSKNGDN